jgi:uncharacterized protein (DUF305 family)
MAGLSTVLLFGGPVPRLLAGSAVASAGTDGDAEALDMAVADTLALLRAGAIATWSDAPDADFAATLPRHDAALLGLARAIDQGAADPLLQRVARRLVVAVTARQQVVGDWQARAASASLWVVSGSSVPMRFVETRLRQALACLPRGNAPSDFACIAACVCHRALDLARIELELGRDPQMKAAAASLATQAAATITDLDDWLMERGHGPPGPAAVVQ